MFKNLFFIILSLFASCNFSYASDLTLSIEWWTSKEVYYNESVSLNALATFPESCTSTWITWTKTIPWFPFPSIITLWTWSNLSTSFTSNTNITVTASCDATSEVTFVFVTLKNPTINVWNNTSYNSWDTVNLSGSIIWTEPGCSVFNYQWEQLNWPEVTINNSIQNEFNSSTYSNANFVFPNTTENIVLKLNIIPQSCYHAGNTYSGTVTYSKNIQTWWGGYSYSSRMRREAENLFYDTWSIDKIELKLLNSIMDLPFINFNWNSIGWDWQINYILEYSTWSNFLTWNIITKETNSLNYNFIEYDLLNDYFIHYFRVKACYLWKCWNYSNTIKYYSEDYLDLSCKKDKKFVDFDDIFLGEDFLIDDVYQVKCENCKN